jgi:hypothetical protein
VHKQLNLSCYSTSSNITKTKRTAFEFMNIKSLVVKSLLVTTAVVSLSAITLCSATPTKAITAEEAIAAIRAFDEYVTKIRQISNPQPQPTMPRATPPSSFEPPNSDEPTSPMDGEGELSTSEEEPIQQGD